MQNFLTRRNNPRRQILRLLTFTALAVASHATRADAQFDILERALSKVESVSLFYLYGGLGSNGPLTTAGTPGVQRSNGLEGFGVELAISLGAIRGRYEMTDEECAADTRDFGSLDTVDVYTETRTVDERTTTTTVVRTRPRATLCKAPDLAELQLALGYSQLRGFGSADPAIVLNGSLAESPAVALYTVFLPQAAVSPYLGLRAGRADMHSLRGYDSNNTVYGGTASALQAGIAAGVAITFLEVFDLVIEPSYLVRNFASVEWRTISGSSGGMLPPQLPRSLDMSGWQLAVGLDFNLPR